MIAAPARALARPAPSLHVRPSRADDLAAMAAIYRANWAAGATTFEDAPPDDAEMARRRAAAVDNGLPHLVAEDASGQVIGWSWATPFRRLGAYRHTVEDSIYVAPDRAGRGIGRRLLGRLIDDCAAAGLQQMLAVVGDSRNAASLGLHRSQGFVQVGLLPAVGYRPGGWVDAVLLQRRLGDDPPPGLAH